MGPISVITDIGTDIGAMKVPDGPIVVLLSPIVISKLSPAGHTAPYGTNGRYCKNPLVIAADSSPLGHGKRCLSSFRIGGKYVGNVGWTRTENGLNIPPKIHSFPSVSVPGTCIRITKGRCRIFSWNFPGVSIWIWVERCWKNPGKSVPEYCFHEISGILQNRSFPCRIVRPGLWPKKNNYRSLFLLI